jgi:2-polyprenyl-6-methoxyphenol hydroxylase-like FAD-dependent oxidoreductase
MKRIAIVGAGQSGLQLGLGLLAAGYEVTMFSNRTGEDIRHGKVMSSQCMFDTSLQIERDLGLDHWASIAPRWTASAWPCRTPSRRAPRPSTGPRA